MKITILDNKYCKIDAININEISVVVKLRTFLSFKTVGVEYTEAYKKGWNGYTYLLSKKNMFMSGLLPKVILFLKENNIIPDITDNRNAIMVGNELIISNRLTTLNKEPRDYQIKIVQAAVNNERGIIRACTGSGKTLVAAMLTAKFNKPTIIYVIGINLLDQFYNTFKEIFDEPIGRIGNGMCDIKRITIASIWTIGKALDLDTKSLLLDDDIDEEDFNGNTKKNIVQAMSKYKIHILDESHIAATNTISTIYKNIEPERIYGLSGTPFRDDGSDLLINGILGEKIIDVSASDLIEKGILAKPFIKFFTVPKMTVSSRNYQTIYKEYIVDNVARNNIILEQTKNLLKKNYCPLVLFKTISHGKILLQMLLNAGIKCSMIYGNDKLEKRLEVMEAFNNGEIDVILASVIFDLGIDLPKISALINAGGSKSTIRTLQKVGRCIRGYPGKKYVAVVDFYDQIMYLKQHSKKRFEIYSSEKGFEVNPSKEMK